MDKIIDATVKLKATQAAGLPGMKEYNAELGRIATAHPDLAKTVDKMIELGRTGIDLENAEMRLRAISDAMKGIATNAQLAAVGYGSIAQYKLNNQQANEARDATERQAVATLQLAQLYPGMSIEAAKTVQALDQQLQLAQARTVSEQLSIQYNQTIGNAELQQRSTTEAIVIATRQRAIADLEINKAAEETLKSLQNEMELIKAVDDVARDRIKSEQTLNKLIRDNVDPMIAQQIAAQQLANATEERAQQEYEINKTAMEAAQNAANAANNTENFAGQSERAAMAWADTQAAIEASNRELRKEFAYIPFALKPAGSGGGYTYQPGQLQQGPQGASQFDPGGYTVQGRDFQAIADELGAATHEKNLEFMQAMEDQRNAEMQNTRAVERNTDAITDVLSPLYSSDPRKSLLGFRGFARGGIMTQYGELPLKTYQSGGVATSPQVAVYGEGSGPEAYVPLQSGKIPVEVKEAANNNQRPIVVTNNFYGPVSRETADQIKRTGFQNAQQMRRAIA
jgi:hypothetical protein